MQETLFFEFGSVIPGWFWK